MSRSFAFFDLDHTLLPYDTQAFFCNYVLQREGWRRVYLLWFLPLALLSATGLIRVRTMKRVFHSYLVGMPRERLERYVEEFVPACFLPVVYPGVWAEVKRHGKEGKVLILNSASPDFYLKPIASALGFDHYLGTRMVVEDRMPLFPKIDGSNNKHGAKIEAMRERGLIPAGVEVLEDAWSYSDSSADLPLLRLAGHGVMIHPGGKLAAVGAEQGWTTMLPERPYSGKWGGRWAMLRQILGCYPVKR